MHICINKEETQPFPFDRTLASQDALANAVERGIWLNLVLTATKKQSPKSSSLQEKEMHVHFQQLLEVRLSDVQRSRYRTDSVHHLEAHPPNPLV